MTDTTATELFVNSCMALGAEVYGRRQIADLRVARSGFERLTLQYPDQCDGWRGLAASGDVRREVLENAYRSIDTVGELIAAADVAVDAVNFMFDTGEYVQLPARGAEGVVLAVAAARAAAGEFEAARDLISEHISRAEPLLAGWMLAVVFIKAKRWHDVRRVLAPLIAQVHSSDIYVHHAISVAQGQAEAYLGMWEPALDRLRPCGGGPIPQASADALLTAGLCARALGREDEAITLLNEAYAVDGISEASRTTIGTAISESSFGILATTAARIDARSDYWDAETEPGERDFAHQLGAARRAELEEEADKELAEFVGMDDVKDQIARLEASARATKLREARGISTRSKSLHLVLKGPPGTGKTTIARVIQKKLAAAAILPGEAFVEVGRGDLVGQHIGTSENIVKDTVARILGKGGGVLFIDEAYALTDSGSENDYGPLVIAELLRVMTNHPDKIMVIAAGYADKMQEFLDSNEGLRSRFTRSITLPSYGVDELVEITVRKATMGGSTIADLQPLHEIYAELTTATAVDTSGRRRAALDVLGNGRFAENLIGFAEEERDYRNDLAGKLAGDATDDELATITGEDLRVAVQRELDRARTEQNIELSRTAEEAR